MSIELRAPAIQSALDLPIDFELEGLTDCPSTNDLALAGPAVRRRLVWTPRQTAGRGRGENVWSASEGCLTFSLVEPRHGLSLEKIPQVSLLSALAMADALCDTMPVRLKWPNDVIAADRKLCGILVENHPDGGLVVGIGLNLFNDVSAITPPAINLQDAMELTKPGQVIPDANQIVGRWMKHFLGLLDLLQSGGLRLPEAWRPLCWLTGRTVELESGERGTCLGLSIDGGLRIGLEGGEERVVYGGVVVPARSGEGNQGV